jgi:cytochrome c biogenesis protein CcdA
MALRRARAAAEMRPTATTLTAVETDPAAGVGIPIAFAAGMVSFLSPCVLPLVPGYLSAVTGVGVGELELDLAAHIARGNAVTRSVSGTPHSPLLRHPDWR